jgi:hypothetical protein
MENAMDNIKTKKVVVKGNNKEQPVLMPCNRLKD